MKLWLGDQGCLGKAAAMGGTEIPYYETVGCEYPEGSEVDHLYGGGLWIGALLDIGSPGLPNYVKAVTTTNERDSIDICWTGSEETTTSDIQHPWYHTSNLNLDEPNKLRIDDDNDGKTDEDELDGIDNDDDGEIDEDYGAVSESDYYCGYTDTMRVNCLSYHRPLGIKVWQRSFVWVTQVRKPIIIMEYNIVNLGKTKMKDVYVGFHLDLDIFIGEHTSSHNIYGYWPELMSAYCHNPIDDWSTPIAVSFLSLPRKISDINFFYRWHLWNEMFRDPSEYYLRDGIRYDWLSGVLPPDTPPLRPDVPSTEVGDKGTLISFGPINNWEAGETLRVAYAIVAGSSLYYAADNLYENARFAQTIYARNYIPPVTIPSPKLSIESGFKSNTLRWDYDGEGVNPEEVWDDKSQLVKLYPEDHWRRINPPEGHTKGGRILEGYRLYRSEDPGGAASSFVMLKQWDIKDSVGPKFGYDTGLEYVYVDSNLHTGKTYWYSVTSYGIPDVNKMEYVDRDGSIKETILESEGKESSVLGSRKRVRLPFSVSNELGKVLVVPNPYRVDDNYTLEFGGYEGRSRSWNENKRILKFTHLPPKCMIRIFTMGGDVVATLHHENQTIGEYDWNMLSESNRTITSGVYVFTVESEYGTQTGKFVVIR